MPRIVRFYETGGPEVLKIEDVDVPPPGPGEVSIAVKAIGLNRAEAMFRGGRYTEEPIFPARLGYEAAGVIRELGDGVIGLAVGDTVSVVPASSITRWGTYGETATVPAESIVKHPDTLSWIEAAATWMQYITAYGALIEVARLRRGDHVVITAASSSVGLAAIQISKMVGAVSIATTRTGAKRQAIHNVGADHVIATAEEDQSARIKQIAGPAGARVIFDAVGGPSFPSLIDAMMPGGIFIVYGALSTAETPFPLFSVLSKTLTIRGYRYKELIADRGRFEDAKQFIIDGLSRSALKPVIDRTFAFDQIVEAHRYLESNVQFGKIVVTV
jgi:NADPH:quinone reductase-like Zn-dependent oxidoreductase